MIRLFPPAASADDQAPIDPLIEVPAETRRGRGGRPWVFTNMIASADGGTAVDGLSGRLGGPGDKAMFSALRSVADVILVGASTVRQERYRAPNPNDQIAAARRGRGQSERPRLAVVSRSLSLEADLPLFEDPGNRPYIVTTETAPADRLDRLRSVAEIIIAGGADVDLGLALGELSRLGTGTVLSEGGPSINGQLVADDLVDEWNLSISPRLLGADSKRAAIGPVGAGPPRGMTLSRVWTDDDFLFCRWIRAMAGGTPDSNERPPDSVEG